MNTFALTFIQAIQTPSAFIIIGPVSAGTFLLFFFVLSLVEANASMTERKTRAFVKVMVWATIIAVIYLLFILFGMLFDIFPEREGKPLSFSDHVLIVFLVWIFLAVVAFIVVANRIDYIPPSEAGAGVSHEEHIIGNISGQIPRAGDLKIGNIEGERSPDGMTCEEMLEQVEKDIEIFAGSVLEDKSISSVTFSKVGNDLSSCSSLSVLVEAADAVPVGEDGAGEADASGQLVGSNGDTANSPDGAR